MGLDFMEMAAGCAAWGVNVAYPMDAREFLEVENTNKTRCELSHSVYPITPRNMQCLMFETRFSTYVKSSL